MEHTFEKWLKYLKDKKIFIQNGIPKHKESRVRQPKTSSVAGVYYKKAKNKWYFIMVNNGVRTCSKSFLTEFEAIKAQQHYNSTF